MVYAGKTTYDPLGQMPENTGKPISEQESKRAYAGEQVTSQDIAKLVKTLWAMQDAVKDLDFSIRSLADQIQNLIIQQRA